MSRYTSLSDRLSRLDLDVLAAAVGALLGLALLPLQLLSSQIFIVTLPVVLLVGSLLYLLAARASGTNDGLPQFSPAAQRGLVGVVFLGLGGMVAAAALGGERTIVFLDLAGVVGVALLAQTLFADERHLDPAVLLVELVAFTAVLRFAATYTTPGYVGVDIWSHTTFVEQILAADALGAIQESKYYASPLYHLLTVATATMGGLSVRNALYLSLGVAMLVAPLFVYGTARLFVPARWALAAGVLYAVADQAIRWGIHLIPTSLGLLFFLACLYSLVRVTHASERWRGFVLLAFFSTAIVLTHQLSSFIMLVLLGGGLVAQVLLRFDLFTDDSEPLAFVGSAAGPVNIAGLVVFDLGLILFTWSLTPYKGDTFLETVLNYLYINLLQAGFLEGVSSGAGGASAAGAQESQQLLATVSTYVTELGFLLLIFAGFVGCLALLNRARASQSTYALVVAITAMLFVVLGLPLFGIENFVPGRWIAFLYAPLAVVGVLGLRHLAVRTPTKVAVVVLLLFVAVYPNVMVLSNDGAMDNPVFPGQHERLSYNEQELAALETVGDLKPPDSSESELYTDDPYGTVWERTDTHPAEPLPARDGRVIPQEFTVYRSYQSEHASYFEANATGETAGRAVNLDPPKEQVCPPAANHVYANGQVTACTLPN
jgi:hypothetical protein